MITPEELPKATLSQVRDVDRVLFADRAQIRPFIEIALQLVNLGDHFVGGASAVSCLPWIKDPLRVDFHLLDRQIVDLNGIPVGKVDDVDLELTDNGVRVTALLVGMNALGHRTGGWLGNMLTRLSRRHEPLRIPYEHVADVGSHITLAMRAEILDEAPLEQWLRDHLIARILGADNDGQ